MMDYPAMRAVAAVVREGSFERAAVALRVTPSAISQRVKLLEERVGAVLVVRGQPCVATEAGRRICRHLERVELLEADLSARLPGFGSPGDVAPVTLRLAVSADSLGTWLIPALAAFSKASPHLLDLVLDDQEHTADWLRKGEVMAAVTALKRPVQGCQSLALGHLVYHATASPDFVARHFPQGASLEALGRAPGLTFNRKDGLQRLWIEQAFGGRSVDHPTHWLPSTEAFVAAALAGLGWGMNPVPLVAEHLAAGRLVELLPGATIEVPLYWQVSRISRDLVPGLTEALVRAARGALKQGAPTG